jgi:hypothetical protein
MRTWESVRRPRFSAGGRIPTIACGMDGTMAEKGEETVYKTRVLIVSDRLELAEHVARGLSTRV